MMCAPLCEVLWQIVELAIQAFPGGLIALAVSLLGVILSYAVVIRIQLRAAS